MFQVSDRLQYQILKSPNISIGLKNPVSIRLMLLGVTFKNSKDRWRMKERAMSTVWKCFFFSK